MGLAWQQGPLAPQAIGQFLVARPCPSGCCSPNRCDAGCASASADSGSPTARTSCSCTSPGAIPSPTSRGGHRRRRAHAERAHDRARDLGATAWYVVHAGEQAPGAAPGSTSPCPATRRARRTTSRSRGGRWTRSMKRTSASSVTPPTATTASTSAKRLAGWWSGAGDDHRRHDATAGPVRVGVRAPLVRAPRDDVDESR